MESAEARRAQPRCSSWTPGTGCWTPAPTPVSPAGIRPGSGADTELPAAETVDAGDAGRPFADRELTRGAAHHPTSATPTSAAGLYAGEVSRPPCYGLADAHDARITADELALTMRGLLGEHPDEVTGVAALSTVPAGAARAAGECSVATTTPHQG